MKIDQNLAREKKSQMSAKGRKIFLYREQIDTAEKCLSYFTWTFKDSEHAWRPLDESECLKRRWWLYLVLSIITVNILWRASFGSTDTLNHLYTCELLMAQHMFIRYYHQQQLPVCGFLSQLWLGNSLPPPHPTLLYLFIFPCKQKPQGKFEVFAVCRKILQTVPLKWCNKEVSDGPHILLTATSLWLCLFK